MIRFICSPGLILLLPFLGNAQQVSQPVLAEATDSVKTTMSNLKFKLAPVVGKDYYYQSLGLACKFEFKVEKATKVPLRLRLGSLQQTDYMERKPNVQKPE